MLKVPIKVGERTEQQYAERFRVRNNRPCTEPAFVILGLDHLRSITSDGIYSGGLWPKLWIDTTKTPHEIYFCDYPVAYGRNKFKMYLAPENHFQLRQWVKDNGGNEVLQARLADGTLLNKIDIDLIRPTRKPRSRPKDAGTRLDPHIDKLAWEGRALAAFPPPPPAPLATPDSPLGSHETSYIAAHPGDDVSHQEVFTNPLHTLEGYIKAGFTPHDKFVRLAYIARFGDPRDSLKALDMIETQVQRACQDLGLSRFEAAIAMFKGDWTALAERSLARRIAEGDMEAIKVAIHSGKVSGYKVAEEKQAQGTNILNIEGDVVFSPEQAKRLSKLDSLLTLPAGFLSPEVIDVEATEVPITQTARESAEIALDKRNYLSNPATATQQATQATEPATDGSDNYSVQPALPDAEAVDASLSSNDPPLHGQSPTKPDQ